MKKNKIKVAKNFEYKEHGLGCSKCMHYAVAYENSHDRCLFILREYIRDYKCDKNIVVDDGATTMCGNIIKHMTKAKKCEQLSDTVQALKMNINLSCPFHSLIEDRFKDTTVEVRS